jgi:hypothetical protein
LQTLPAGILRSRVLNRRHNPAVAGTAADISVHAGSNLFLGRMGVPVQQRFGGQNHARRAETALYRAFIDKRLLKRVEPAAAAQSLDGRYIAAVCRYCQRQARQDRRSVHEYRAGAAVARVSSALPPGHSKVVSEHVQQRPIISDDQGTVYSVDFDTDYTLMVIH